MGDSKTKKLYINVLNKDWNALKEKLLSFENDVELLLRPISVHGDSIIHLVVHSGTEELLNQILCWDKLAQDLELLHCFTRSVNIYGNTVLHEAAISGNLEAVKLLVENDEELLRMDELRTEKLYRNVLHNDWKALKEDLLPFEEDVDQLKLLLGPISVHGDSIIHLVVHSGTEEPLKQILCRAQDLDLLHSFTTSNKYGNTILHEAAISGNLAAVKLLVKKNKDLLVMKNDFNETPLFKAAAFKFLAACGGQTVDSSDEGTKQLIDIHRKNKNGETVLFAAVQGQHFGTALELLKIDEKLTDLEDGNQTSFNMLVQIPSAFIEMSIWKKLLFFFGLELKTRTDYKLFSFAH
ncbi:hypothetical protein Q3G72_006200 [Acer saccharum]|nr:hypothetical protein Q3G72_006200 [Acer saccharum]